MDFIILALINIALVGVWSVCLLRCARGSSAEEGNQLISEVRS
jgi:hypothetical protein